MAENGKWSLAFWIMATVCVGGLVTLGANVVANDRIRAEADGKLQDKIEFLVAENNKQFMAITGDLREIKALMSRQNVVHNS